MSTEKKIVLSDKSSLEIKISGSGPVGTKDFWLWLLYPEHSCLYTEHSFKVKVKSSVASQARSLPVESTTTGCGSIINYLQ